MYRLLTLEMQSKTYHHYRTEKSNIVHKTADYFLFQVKTIFENLLSIALALQSFSLEDKR